MGHPGKRPALWHTAIRTRSQPTDRLLPAQSRRPGTGSQAECRAPCHGVRRAMVPACRNRYGRELVSVRTKAGWLIGRGCVLNPSLQRDGRDPCRDGTQTSLLREPCQAGLCTAASGVLQAGQSRSYLAGAAVELPEPPQTREAVLQSGQDQPNLVPVLEVGGMHRHGQQQTLDIHHCSISNGVRGSWTSLNCSDSLAVPSLLPSGGSMPEVISPFIAVRDLDRLRSLVSRSADRLPRHSRFRRWSASWTERQNYSPETSLSRQALWPNRSVPAGNL